MSVSSSENKPKETRIKQCSKCGQSFGCGCGDNSCWCNELNVPKENLKRLFFAYDNCLCPDCLKDYSEDNG